MNPYQFKQLVAYFEQIATSHYILQNSPTRKSFFRFEINEFLQALPSEINFPAMAMEENSWTLQDNNSDNVFKRRYCGFMLMQKINDPGNFTEVSNAFDYLEEIADDIVARMHKDKVSRRRPGEAPAETDPVAVVRHISFNTIETEPVGFSRFPSVVALRTTFEIETPFRAQYDPDKWL